MRTVKGDQMPQRAELSAPELQEARQGIGPAIEALRVRAGFSRTELAERAGLGRSTILKIEKGERTPSPETMRTIAQELGTDTDALLTAAWIAADPSPDVRRKRASDIIHLLTGKKARKAMPYVAGAALIASAPVSVPSTIVAAATAGIVAATRTRSKRSPDENEQELLRLQLLAELATKGAEELHEVLAFVKGKKRSSSSKSSP
jgi:transcriptional regulator with XRE-family HTH domain